MTTITPTRTPNPGNAEFTIIEWASLTSSVAGGEPIEASGLRDKCFHAYGTWGGATLTLYGSNKDNPTESDSNWVKLKDVFGTAIDLTADSIVQVAEAPKWIKAKLSTAGSGASVNCRIFGTRR